jgi:hypothetical protein
VLNHRADVLGGTGLHFSPGDVALLGGSVRDHLSLAGVATLEDLQGLAARVATTRALGGANGGAAGGVAAAASWAGCVDALNARLGGHRVDVTALRIAGLRLADVRAVLSQEDTEAVGAVGQAAAAARSTAGV